MKYWLFVELEKDTFPEEDLSVFASPGLLVLMDSHPRNKGYQSDKEYNPGEACRENEMGPRTDPWRTPPVKGGAVRDLFDR